ncbi:hypothetical protein Sango_3048500 [Sesamum angolense]|uniref:Uncharacterized protein n=1 Tax=Sesamum angolense TaxID=2727404 RepID=A0AAE1TAG5_9LAMI|nr:hypothetical protein Sango_3048500 [Sesamum angolense]
MTQPPLAISKIQSSYARDCHDSSSQRTNSRIIGTGNSNHTDQASRDFHMTIPASHFNRPLGVGFIAAKLMRNPTPRVNLSICGHFVVILKSRSISVPIQLAFGHPFQHCGLKDLGFDGETFTWTNRREELHTVRACLDRACSDQRWADMFPQATIHPESVACSDHSVAWSSAGNLSSNHTLFGKIRFTRVQLSEWNKDNFGNIKHKTKELNEKLTRLQQGRITPEVRAKTKILRESLEKSGAKEEILWKHRAKALWLKEGDR